MSASSNVVPPSDLTTLITFRLQGLHQVGTIDLYGSWDNFRQAYPMRKDTQIGHGSWYGCHEFRSIICDGDPANCTEPRNGGLTMNGTYWFYYVRNGNEEFFDPNIPTTIQCPLRPGEKVNMFEIPTLSITDPDENSCDSWMTMDPMLRSQATRMPPTPSDHPYRANRPRTKLSPRLATLRHDLFNDSLARVQTAVVDSIIGSFVSPLAADAESRFNKDPLVRKLAALALPPPAETSSPWQNLPRTTTLRRKATTEAKRPISRTGKHPRGFQPIKEFSNPFMAIAPFGRPQTAGELNASRPSAPETETLALRPHTWAEDCGAVDRDVQRSLLHSRCERRTASAMGFFPSAPELVRKPFKAKRMASLRKSLRVSNKNKEKEKTLPPIETGMLQKQLDASRKNHEAQALARLTSAQPQTLASELLSPTEDASASRPPSQRPKRSMSFRDRFRLSRRKSNAEAPPPLPPPASESVSSPTADDAFAALADGPGSFTQFASHRSSIIPSPVLGPSRDSAPTHAIAEEPLVLDQPASQHLDANQPAQEGRATRLRHRLSQRFMRAPSRSREVHEPENSAAAAVEQANTNASEPVSTDTVASPTEARPKTPQRSLVRKISQRFLGRGREATANNHEAISRPQTSTRRPQTAKQAKPAEPAVPATTSPEPKQKLTHKLSRRFFGRTKTQPSSPEVLSPQRSRAGTLIQPEPSLDGLSRLPTTSQETLRGVQADADAPPVPLIPQHYASPPTSPPLQPPAGLVERLRSMSDASASASTSIDLKRSDSAFSVGLSKSRRRSRHQSGMTHEGIAGLTPPLLQCSEFSTPSTQNISEHPTPGLAEPGPFPNHQEADPRESFCEAVHRAQIRELLKGTVADQQYRNSLDGGEDMGGFSYLGAAIL